MSQVVYVGTRKGLFVFDLHDDGAVSEPRVLGFLAVPVSMLLDNPQDKTLYAALTHGHSGVKLHRSSDAGKTWDEVAVPQYPMADREDDKATAPALSEIWSLESGGQLRPDVLWCGTIPGGLFRSTDRGDSWELVESLWNCDERKEWFGGGKDHPGIHSICVDPRDNDVVTLGISCGGIWRTTDAGQTWNLMTNGMRAEYMPPDKQFYGNTQDPHRLVQCRDEPDTFWVQHHNGIFVSFDNCESWRELTPANAPGFGFAVSVDPTCGRRAWFVPAVKDECRVPADGRFMATRTSNGGDSFEILHEGLPKSPAWDIVFRHSLDVDRSGRCLAMGSTTGGLWTSADGGDHWKIANCRLPPVYCVRIGMTN